MKLTKFLTTILVAVLLATAASGCSEDEWNKMTDDQRFIETLISQSSKTISIQDTDFSFRKVTLDPYYRCVMVNTHIENFDSLFNLYRYQQRKDIKWMGDSCCWGFICPLDDLRQELMVSNDSKVLFRNWEVLSVEDVYTDPAHNDQMITFLPYTYVIFEPAFEEKVTALKNVLDEISLNTYSIKYDDDCCMFEIYQPLGIKTAFLVNFILSRITPEYIDESSYLDIPYHLWDRY